MPIVAVQSVVCIDYLSGDASISLHSHSSSSPARGDHMWWLVFAFLCHAQSIYIYLYTLTLLPHASAYDLRNKSPHQYLKENHTTWFTQTRDLRQSNLSSDTNRIVDACSLICFVFFRKFRSCVYTVAITLFESKQLVKQINKYYRIILIFFSNHCTLLTIKSLRLNCIVFCSNTKFCECHSSSIKLQKRNRVILVVNNNERKPKQK